MILYIYIYIYVLFYQQVIMAVASGPACPVLAGPVLTQDRACAGLR